MRLKIDFKRFGLRRRIIITGLIKDFEVRCIEKREKSILKPHTGSLIRHLDILLNQNMFRKSLIKNTNAETHHNWIRREKNRKFA